MASRYLLTILSILGLFVCSRSEAIDCSTESTQLGEYHSPQRFCVGSKLYRAQYMTESQLQVDLVTITQIDYTPGFEFGPIQPHRITNVHFQKRNGTTGVEIWEGYSGSGGAGGDTFAYPQFNLFMFPSGCILIDGKQHACVGQKVSWTDEDSCQIGADGFSHCKSINATLTAISDSTQFLALVKGDDGKSFYKEFDNATQAPKQ